MGCEESGLMQRRLLFPAMVYRKAQWTACASIPTIARISVVTGIAIKVIQTTIFLSLTCCRLFPLRSCIFCPCRSTRIRSGHPTTIRTGRSVTTRQVRFPGMLFPSLSTGPILPATSNTKALMAPTHTLALANSRSMLQIDGSVTMILVHQ